MEGIIQNIIDCEGQVFQKIKGKPFKYSIKGQSIQILGDKLHSISFTNIISAWNEGHVNGPSSNSINIVRPSYVWALLNVIKN
ncbi:hypothetical protein [Lacihabitans soyangensis]|uniref:Uncharacterized protein n=1 Tax=Lacihabitans soyangensis TaxID=869394 RepID=A0AAE3GYR4_9BACT|nr:hypothetical protein [Lacihabitans soyangensis]MCP9761517.1 hypothetical protein [Lacihabitans soyangensis]